MTLLFWAINNAIYDKTTPERLKIITDLVKPAQILYSLNPTRQVAPLSLL